MHKRLIEPFLLVSSYRPHVCHCVHQDSFLLGISKEKEAVCMLGNFFML